MEVENIAFLRIACVQTRTTAVLCLFNLQYFPGLVYKSVFGATRPLHGRGSIATKRVH